MPKTIPAPLGAELAQYGPPAFEALAASIGRAQAADPLAPVTVVVPSNLAGLSLRRELARRHPLVNVRFLVLARLAELLGAPRLAAAGRTPLTRWRRYTAVQAVLQRSPESFTAVSAHPSTLRALDRAFRDLAPVADAALRQLGNGGGTPSTVARLCRLFRQQTDDCYTEDDLADSACLAIEEGSAALTDLGLVIVYLPGPLAPEPRRLVQTLVAQQRANVIAGVTGDAAADGAAIGVAAGALPLPSVEPPDVQDIAVVADAAEEVRMAIRLAMAEAASGEVPLDRVAMLYTGHDYGPLLHEQLAAAGIPHNGPPIATLAETLPGRTLLGLLSIDPAPFTRVAVFDWLASAEIRDPDGRPVPSRRWERLAIEAGVARGLGQWRARIATLREGFLDAAELARAEGDFDRERWREEDAENASRLLAFAETLHTSLDNWPTQPSQALAHCRELLNRYLGGPLVRDGWTEADRDAFERVDELLQEAAGSRDVGSAFGLQQFRSAIAWLLGQPATRVGPFGQGIFVAPFRLASGMQFDRVYILGMAEGQAPSVRPPSPLLPEAERARLGIPAPSDLAAEERRAYLAALASAPRRTLLFARADLRVGRAQHPSRWLLQAASRLSGRRISSPALESLPASDWFTPLPSFAAAVNSTCHPATLHEYDLRLLLRGPRNALENPLLRSGTLPSVATGIAAWRARRFSPEPEPLTRWDGNIGSIPGLSAAGASPVSASALESMATCPFRYFLRYQLGVREREDPVDELQITAVVRGALIHRILERFFLETQEAGSQPLPGHPWNSAGFAQLATIADEECDRDEARGVTGAALLWQLERRRIQTSLAAFLETDSQHRMDGFEFASAEQEFGDDAAPASLRLPDGRTIRFRGRIDRVDTSDSETIVYDYKTGRPNSFTAITKGDPFAAGQHLQLAIYGIALGAGRAGGPPVSAKYWFIGEDPQEIGYEVSKEQLGSFARVIDALDTTVGRGLFPINSGDKNKNCKYCAFEAVCPPQNVRRERLLQRRETPGLEPYAALAGLADLRPQDGDDDYSG